MMALRFNEKMEIVLNEKKPQESITKLIFTLTFPKYLCVENNQSYLL